MQGSNVVEGFGLAGQAERLLAPPGPFHICDDIFSSRSASSSSYFLILSCLSPLFISCTIVAFFRIFQVFRHFKLLDLSQIIISTLSHILFSSFSHFLYPSCIFSSRSASSSSYFFPVFSNILVIVQKTGPRLQ